jgi:DNA-binding transcriptional regulator YiaG
MKTGRPRLVDVEAHRRALENSARRIKTIRTTLGMTQLEFAFYTRVAVNTVSAWENGLRLPSPLAETAIKNVAVEHGLDLHQMRRFVS